mmetsp:Transcript_49155/g.81609  ORF Transcript_49155/g.81609 Transcript_49155/m.81609 type:complete len:91 (+) Transcript_49155:414-686(+)
MGRERWEGQRIPHITDSMVPRVVKKVQTSQSAPWQCYAVDGAAALFFFSVFAASKTSNGMCNHCRSISSWSAHLQNAFEPQHTRSSCFCT